MQIFTDKEILGDGLSTQKCTTDKFNMAANECAHPQLRRTMMQILEQEHNIQFDVFNIMHQKGFYQTPPAEDKKVQEAKQKFAASAK